MSKKRLNITVSSFFVVMVCLSLFFAVADCTGSKQEEFTHIISSSNSSPDSTIITAYDDGVQLKRTRVSNKAYEILFTTENATETIDSIKAEREGYISSIVRSCSVTEKKTLDINLILIQDEEIFWLYGTQSTPGASVSVFDEGEEIDELTINSDGTYQSSNLALPSDNAIDSVRVTATGYEKKLITNITVQQNGNELELIIDRTLYNHWFSNSTSTPGSHAVWYQGNIAVMSADINESGQYTTNTWTTSDITEVIDSVVATKTGFDRFRLTNLQALEGNNDLCLDLSATTYTYCFTGIYTTPNGTSVEVWEDGQSIASATVTGTAYTTTNWTSTLTGMTIDSVTFKKDGYITQRVTNISVVPGSNSLNVQLEQITYTYRLVSTNSSPEGTSVVLWENGQSIASATVTGTTYTTPNWTSTLTSMIIDSVTFKKDGYVTQRVINKTVYPGDNTQDANLSAVTYDYWLTGNNTTPEGTGIKVWENGSNIASATVTGTAFTTGTWTSTLTGMTIDSVIFSKEGYIAQTMTSVAVTPGSNELNVQLTQTTTSYDYWLTGNNTTPEGTGVKVWENGSNIASATVTGAAYTTGTWTSTLTGMTIDSVIFSKEGYIAQTMTSVAVTPGSNELNVQLAQVTYNYVVTFNLISSEASEGHLVRDSPITITTSKGTTTLTTSAQTLTYAWTGTSATETITYDITPTGTGHQDPAAKQTSVSPGSNTINETLTANDWTGDVTYHVTDKDTEEDIEGADVSTTQSKSGTTNASGNITLYDYDISENTYSEPTSTSISHTITKDNYSTKTGSASITTGTNNVEATLEAITNTFTEDIVFADQTADNYDDGLVFVIKTLSDNQEHTYTVTSGQQVQSITLTGDYDENTSIELYYTSTSAAAQGKEANILTVVRSRQQPSASNGSRTTTLTTTIDDFFTPSTTGDTAWVLSLTTDMYDDEAFRTHVNGGKEWVYSSGGNRTMNIYGITREVDLSAGTYGDDITADELQAIEDRVALFNQDFWNRETGLVILNVNYTETTTYHTGAGSINLFYDRTDPQPANGHYQLSTTRANTYDFGFGYVPYGTVMFLGQFAAEATQAVDYVFDYQDQMGDIVDTDDNGNNPYFIREDDLVVNMTYVGGEAPKNE